MRYAHLTVLAILFLTMAKITYASTSSVTINSNTTTTGQSTSTSESHVRIETDGVVKEFNTSGDESVDWKSDDGKSSIKINNNGTSVQSGSESHTAGTSGTITPSPTATPSSHVTPTSKPDDQDSKRTIPVTPLSMIMSLVQSLISLF